MMGCWRTFMDRMLVAAAVAAAVAVKSVPLAGWIIIC
jgi:hypothetical protein